MGENPTPADQISPCCFSSSTWSTRGEATRRLSAGENLSPSPLMGQGKPLRRHGGGAASTCHVGVALGLTATAPAPATARRHRRRCPLRNARSDRAECWIKLLWANLITARLRRGLTWLDGPFEHVCVLCILLQLYSIVIYSDDNKNMLIYFYKKKHADLLEGISSNAKVKYDRCVEILVLIARNLE